MSKFIRQVLDFIGYGQTIQAIAQAEFVRTLLLPTLVSVMTGGQDS